MNPKSIMGTRRQRVTTRSGEVMSRQYIYMDEQSWEALRGLCAAQNHTGSQVIASLINIATLAHAGDQTEIQHAQTAARTN
jgi:hypothetical protein